MFGTLAAFWGYLGIFLLLSSAIARLAPGAFELSDLELSFLHWALLAFSIIFMGFAEGYRGFQKGFAPRVAARLRFLQQNPTVLRALFAPLFCMGFFYTTRKRKIVSYSLTFGIICLVIIVHFIAQPWRGIIDAGVVFGLIWGLLSMTIFTIQAFSRATFSHSPETPCKNTELL